MSAAMAWALANPGRAATYALVAALVVLLGFSRLQLAHLRGEYAAHLAGDAAAISTAKTVQRDKEAAATVAQAAVETDYLEEARNAAASADRTISDLRAGALQLRPALTCAGAGVPGATAGAAKRDAAGQGGLRPADAEFLVQLADRADANAIRLNACLRVVEADRRACGVQGDP